MCSSGPALNPDILIRVLSQTQESTAQGKSTYQVSFLGKENFKFSKYLRKKQSHYIGDPNYGLWNNVILLVTDYVCNGADGMNGTSSMPKSVRRYLSDKES